MRTSLFVFLTGLGMAPTAFSAAFPMPKTGEWKVTEVDASASRSQGNSSIECIETQDRKRWEEDFKTAARDNGMDCQLTVKSESATRLAYDIQCKGRRPEGGSASVQVYSQDAEGALVFQRQSATKYTIEQEIKLVAMKNDGADAQNMSEKQKRMMQAATRHTADSTTKMKNEYTFVGPKCSQPPATPQPGPDLTPRKG